MCMVNYYDIIYYTLEFVFSHKTIRNTVKALTKSLIKDWIRCILLYYIIKCIFINIFKSYGWIQCHRNALK